MGDAHTNKRENTFTTLDGKRPAWNRVECIEGFKTGLKMPVATALNKL